jgi:hypothetical protein
MIMELRWGRGRIGSYAPAVLVVVPCRAQRLDQPRGVTLTTVRRPQWAQYLGGSNSRAAAHAV